MRRSSELLQRQAGQLTRLVDDLLDVARITRGAIELKKEPLEIERVLETAIESIQPLTDSKYQTVTLRRAPEVVLVEADSVRLCQILTNLLTNAKTTVSALIHRCCRTSLSSFCRGPLARSQTGRTRHWAHGCQTPG